MAVVGKTKKGEKLRRRNHKKNRKEKRKKKGLGIKWKSQGLKPL